MNGKINEDEITVIDLRADSAKSSFKSSKVGGILKVQNVPSVMELVECLSDGTFFNNFNDSTCCLLQLEINGVKSVKDVETFKKIVLTNLSAERAALIQLAFKDSKDNILLVKDCDATKWEHFDLNDIDDEPSNKFMQLLNETGFKGDVLTCEIDEETYLKYYATSHLFILDFLNLFAFENQYEIYTKILRELVINGSLESFQFFYSKNQDKAFNMLPEDMKDIVNCAWDNKRYENLLFLLNHDSPFPHGFKLNEIEDLTTREVFKKLIDSRRKLHEGIKDNDIGSVEEFVKQYPYVKIGYNPSNVPALRASLEREKELDSYEITAFLRSKYFEIDEEEWIELIQGMTFRQKDCLEKEIEKKIKKHPRAHILYLLSRIKFAFVTNEEIETHGQKVIEYLERLDSIKEISPLLEVIEQAPLIISFDYRSTSIDKMTPRGTKSCHGIFFPRKRKIYLGAKGRDDYVAGVLGHELAHYAFNILFDNNCKPYDFTDHENKSKFSMIVKKCQEQADSRVQVVFDDYPELRWIAELIVRIPHLLAESDKNRNMLEANFGNLFDYYKEVVLTRAKDFLLNRDYFLNLRKIQKLNLQFAADAILKKNLWLNTDDSKIANEDGLRFIVSNVPHLVMTQLYQQKRKEKITDEIKKPFIFVSLHDLSNNINWDNVYEMWTTNANVVLVINCENNFVENSVEPWRSIIQSKNLENLILICDNDEKIHALCCKLEICTSQSSKRTIDYYWNDLTKDTKEKLLQTEIIFQGSKIKLCQLIYDSSDESLNKFPLNRILEKSEIKIGRLIDISDGYNSSYYIPRTFKDSNKCDESLLDDDDSAKLVLISDDAGMGKSTICSHLNLKLKEREPATWVIRIDLHDYVKLFQKSDLSELKTIEWTKRFVFENFAKNTNESDLTLFEKKIFYRTYSKFVIMLDGFDEIAPFCEDKVKQFIKTLHEFEDIKVWITTRPHFRNYFEGQYKIVVLELTPFSKDNQIEFLVSYWATKSKTYAVQSDKTDLKLFAKKLVDLTNTSYGHYTFLGIPLQTHMIAEIYEDEINEIPLLIPAENTIPKYYEILDSYSLFKKFITQKMMIARKNKGEKILQEICESESDPTNPLNIYSVCERLAMQTLFNLDTKVNSHEIKYVQLHGLIHGTIKNETPSFIHRSFAEYFAATYIIRTILDGSFESILLNQDQFFIKILSSNLYEVIRSFMDDFLLHSDYENTFSEANCRKFSKYLEEFWIENDKSETIWKNYFLHQLLDEKKIFLFDFFFKCLSHCRNENIKLVLMECRNNKSIEVITTKTVEFVTHPPENLLECAARNGIKSLLEKVWVMASKVLSRDDKKNYFFRTYGVWSSAIHCNKANILQSILFTMDIYKQETYALETMSLENLKSFYKSGKRIYEIRSMNHEKYSENCVVASLINICKTLELTKLERKELILNDKLLPLFCNPNKLKEIYPILLHLELKLRKEICTDTSFIEWLSFDATKNPHNRFHRVLYVPIKETKNNGELIKILFVTMQKALNSYELKNFICQSMRYISQLEVNIQSIKMMYDYLTKNALNNEVKHFFGAADGFFNIAIRQDSEHFNRSMTHYFSTLSEEHMKYLILNKFSSSKGFNNPSDNIFQVLTSGLEHEKNHECLVHFLNELVKKFHKNDIDFILEKQEPLRDYSNLVKATLQNSLSHEDDCLMTFLLNHIPRNRVKNRIINHLWDYLPFYPTRLHLPRLIFLMKETLNQEEIKESMLKSCSEEDRNKFTLFHYAATCSEVFAFREFLKLARSNMNDIYFMKLMRRKDNNGRSM